MTSPYAVAPLGTAIRQHKAFIEINDFDEYKRCRVQLHAKGVILRDTVPGSEIKTKRQQVCKAAQLLVAEIDAKVGGFGIVPSDLDGAIVSSHYFLFDLNRSKLDDRYLDFFIRTPEFRNQVQAQGSTNYAAIRPNDVLEYMIPLPPLEEQRRIVDRIEGLVAKIEEAKNLQRQVESDIKAMLLSTYYRITELAEHRPMAEVAPILRRPVEVVWSRGYLELGIRSFGNGTFHKPPVLGSDLGSKRIYWISKGDLLFNNVFAWEGAVAVVKAEDEGRVGSHRFITCVPQHGMATAYFLCFHFLTPNGLEQLREASPGGAGRNRTLNLKKLENLKVPVPDYSKQLWFDGLLAKSDNIRHYQLQTSTQLDAMLPSILDKAFKGEL